MVRDYFSKDRREGVFLLLLGALSCAVYLNSLFGGFVLDDMVLIQKNPVIHSLFDIQLLTYRWLRTFSYATDYAVWGLNPVGYHLSNILYNTLAVLVVYFLTKRLTKRFILSFVTAILFALHPIHTETVSYLSGRRDILSALFYLLGFSAYLKGRVEKGKKYYVWAFFAYLLSLSAKEMGVTLPILIVAYEILREIEENRERADSTLRLFTRALQSNLVRFRWLILLSALLVGGYLYVDLFLEHASGMVSAKGIKWWGGNPVSNFATVATVLASYIKKLFFPVVLRFDYRMFPISHSFAALPVLGSLALLTGLILLSFRMMRRNFLVTFGIWFFFITLLPVMQFIPHHMLMAEHYLYLPSYGFCLIGGILAEKTIRRGRLLLPFGLAFILLISLFFARTVARNQDWLDTFTLTAEGIRHDPGNPVYHFFRGHAYHLAHLERSAWRELEEAVHPNLYRDSKVFAIRAAILFKQGEYAKGEKETNKALDIDGHDQMAFTNGGYFALMMGENQKALSYYLKVRPDYEGGRYLQNIARIYLEEGRPEQAENTMRRLIRLLPDRAEAHYDLAEVLIRELRFDEAIKEYEKALILADTESLSGYLKGVPEKIRWGERLRRKLDAFKREKRLDSPGADIAYGRLYLDAGNDRDAAQRFREALDRGDRSPEIRCLLAKALLKEGKRENAFDLMELIPGDMTSLPDECLEAGTKVFRGNLRFEEAMARLRVLALRHPDDPSFGKRFEALKKMASLEREAERLARAKDAAGAARARGDLYLKLGRVKEAIRFYASALKPAPGNLALLHKLYDLYEGAGYPYRQKAIRTGRTILKTDPKDTKIALRLWRLYYHQVQDYESALIFLEQGVKAGSSPAENRKIRSALDSLRSYVAAYGGEVRGDP